MYIVYINDAFQTVAEAGQTVHLNRSPSISYKPFNILTTAGKKQARPLQIRLKSYLITGLSRH